MNQNNNIRNIYIKCTRTYNKNIKNSFHKTNDIKEENLTDKNNIVFIKNNNLIGQNNTRESIKSFQNSKPIDRLQNKKLAIYYNKNEKKKLMNDNMNYLIDNIEKDNNVMTNAVNIHNINLINSMNNITVYDSYNDNKIPHLKSDIMKYPINKMSCQTYNKNKDYSIKGNYSMDLNLNEKEEKKNIIVNKKRTLIENKSNNIDNLELFNTINDKYKNNSLSKKKNPFQELNYKKLSNNFKSCAKFNKGNNYSNFNKQDNKININNTYNNPELVSTREIEYPGENSQIKNRNNAVNKSISKDNTNTTNKTDFSIFNNYSNYTSSVAEEEINGNKNKNIFDKKDNKDNRKNVINVNKLDSFKISNSNNKKNNMNTSINFSNYKSSDNNSNIKNSSNSSSNIFSLLSNKNKENNNKSLLDRENLNKIKKNINKEKLCKTRSKDNAKNKKKLEKNKSLRCNMKTKSEEKKINKNKDNKNTENNNLTTKIKMFSSFLNENVKNNNYKKNGLGNIYVKDSNNYANNASTYNNSNCSKFFYSTFNSDNGLHSLIQNPKKKTVIYPNKINYNKEIQNLIKLSISNVKNDNGNTNDNGNNIFKNNNNDINLFEKIEVNKKNYHDLSKKVDKSQLNNKSTENAILDIRNETTNVFPKKTLKRSWLNNTDQINIFPKNLDYYCYLSNYKEKKDQSMDNMDNTENLSRKKSAPKKNIENIIYNKKTLYHIKNGRKGLEDKILSPDNKQKQKDFTEYEVKNNDQNCMTEEMFETDNIKNKNLEEEITINFNFKEMDIADNMSEKFININKKMIMKNKTFLLKSPQSTVYKKPGVNNSNSMMINGKDSFNNQLPLYSNKIIENEKDIFIHSSKKKNRKKYLNIKLNRLMEPKELSNENKTKKNTININNINYDKDELLPKFKENNVIQTINSYKKMKNNLTNKENNKPNKDNNKSKDFIINSEQFSVTKINKKVPCNNSFMRKYGCYYIDYNPDKKNNCFITKIRLNKYNLIINEIPIKKICYFSKKRKIFVKVLPISQTCYFKKDIIMHKKYNEDENLIINCELYDNKKENDEITNIKFNNYQSSFVSLNSNENNYFEISFGKKMNKSLINLNNENLKYNLNNNNNNDILLNKLLLPERNNEEKSILSNLFNIENKFLNNNINISPSKKNSEDKNILNSNNENYLKKTEKGLKLLEKIADQRIIPITEKIKTIYITNNNNNQKNDIKNNQKNESIKNNQKNESIKNNQKNESIRNNQNKNEHNNNKCINIKLKSGGRHKLNSNSNLNKKNSDKNTSNKKKSNNLYKNIKNDYIELLNIIAINNYDIILNKISDLILNNNMVTIDNISQLLKNQNIFAEVIINKAIKEKKYMKIYSKLCKDLFISLMSIIDNYNDDMDIFDKITKDKSLKVILKNKIIEKINQFNFTPEPTFGMRDKKIFERDPFYYDLKFQFSGLFYFVGELLEVKIVSQKTGFEILEILYKRYIKGNNKINTNLINDLNLEGIEILLSKMKIIVYVKNNPEHIQMYNKFIKNNLNNIFKKRSNKNDMQKYLFYKLFNIIENQKNEQEINKVKTFVGPKNKKSTLNIVSDNDKNEYIKIKNNSNSFTNIDNKYSTINNGNNNFKNVSKDNIGNSMIEMIKKDIEKFLYDSNKNQIKYDLLTEINKKYNEELNIKKSIYIWEIFYYYVEVCIDIINTEEKIYIVNEYIENIINNFAIDLPNENWEMLHYKLISLFLNINEICTDNIYMHQIMGNLLFMLINNKLFYIKDLNNFLNKDNEVIINIAKVVKFAIIFADKDAKKYHNDFKQTKLFIGNNIFYEIVTIPLNKKYLSII